MEANACQGCNSAGSYSTAVWPCECSRWKHNPLPIKTNCFECMGFLQISMEQKWQFVHSTKFQLNCTAAHQLLFCPPSGQALEPATFRLLVCVSHLWANYRPNCPPIISTSPPHYSRLEPALPGSQSGHIGAARSHVSKEFRRLLLTQTVSTTRTAQGPSDGHVMGTFSMRSAPMCPSTKEKELEKLTQKEQ